MDINNVATAPLFLMDFPKKKEKGNFLWPASASSFLFLYLDDARFVLRGFRRFMHLTHGTSCMEHVASVTLNDFLSTPSLPPVTRHANGTGCERGASSLRRPGYPSRLIKGLIVQKVHENPTKKRQPAAVNYFTQDSSLLI